MQLHYLIHRFNHLLRLPRGQKRLSRFVMRHSSIPPKLNNVCVNFGLLMDLEMHHPNDREIYFNTKEPEVCSAIAKYVREEATVFDIGANIGYFSLLMAHQVGPRGKVYAFEPNPAMGQRLLSHAVKNHFENVIKLHTCALAARSGFLTLYLNGDNPGQSSLAVRAGLPHTEVQVQVETLDELFARDAISAPSFIKTDTEGADLLVLRGGEKLIQQARPVIVAEINPKQLELFNCTVEAIWKWADTHNYSIGLLHSYKGYQTVPREVISSLSRGNILLIPD